MTQLTTLDTDTLSLPGELTAIGWQPPTDLPYEQWERNIQLLTRLGNASRFWLGDGLEFGQQVYGEKYAQAIDQTGLSYGRLANITYTCRRVAISRRRENLSFEHHTTVAPLPDDEQEDWLHWAECEAATTKELEEAIAESRGDPPPSSYTDTLKRDNGDLRRQVAELKSQAARQAAADPLAPVDEAYQRDRGNREVICPRCGAKFEVEYDCP